jgi:hypothetical protein
MSEPSPHPEPLPRFPRHPFEEEIIDDWRWIYLEAPPGHFVEYGGEHVAVCEKKILGSSRDPDLLRQSIAEKHNIDPERLVIFYVG